MAANADDGDDVLITPEVLTKALFYARFEELSMDRSICSSCFRRDAAGEGEFSEERVRQAYQQMGLEFPTLAELVQAAMDMPTALQAVLQSAFALTKDFAPTF